MDEYLRRVQSRLVIVASEQSIHAVLGGPEPDVDTVAATLSLALHLGEKEKLYGRLCVPVFCGQQCSTVLPEDTVQYLQTMNIHESLLLWRDDINLSSLHHTGKLSLTLLRDGLLDRSEYHALESSILRVVHHDGQQDTGDDGASFAVTTVAREIRQEAAEHVRATLRKTLGEALRLQSKSLWTKHGRQSSELEELRQYLDELRDITAGRAKEMKQEYLEQLHTAELKEFTGGGMTIALSSVTTENEDWHVFVEGLKSVSQNHNLDGLVVVLLSSSDTVHHSHRQVAVYSNNTAFLNQICSELKESSSWCLAGELEKWENLQIYNVLSNTASSDELRLLQDELQGILKAFMVQQSSAIKCHPSSRTSSTEGVAGNVEFSQGSSGIIDMFGSDNDRADESSADAIAISRVMRDGEEDTGGTENSAVVELVSPDSGMTTIRSSRSSKESSVLLSDDSTLGEITTGGVLIRNPSNFGMSSQTPPVPPQRKKHHPSRNANDNFNLSSFDPMHHQTVSIKKELVCDDLRGGQEETGMDTSNLSELEKLSLLYFSEKSIDTLEGGRSLTDHHGQILESEMTDNVVLPTSIKSLIDTPPSSFERISDLPHKESEVPCFSKTCNEFGFDTQGALSPSYNQASNRTHNVVTEREAREDILKTENIHKMQKRPEPQLSLVTEQSVSYGTWISDSELQDQWNPVTLSELQLTPPEEEGTGKFKADLMREKRKENPQLMLRKKAIPKTLTPESSKEDDEAVQGKKDRQVELIDFWTYSAQKGFLKSDSGTTTSYPDSLDMWNMTIRDDSLSPLTTPDNLSDNSGSFCGVNHNVVGGSSLESLQEFSDGGMKMWNTTIQEDSSSTVTSPEGPESGKDLSHMGSLEATESSVTYTGKQLDEEMVTEERQGGFIAIDETPEDFESRGMEHNVKIVIETAEESTHSKESDDDTQTPQNQQSFMQNLASECLENESTADESTNMWELPAPGMVSSTSEYDNVGAGIWSLGSSPDTYGSPAADIEGLSSPFVAVTKPFHKNKDQYHEVTGNSDIVVLKKEESGEQVFHFGGLSEFNPITRIRGSSLESEYDNRSIEESVGTDSPFFMVDISLEIPTVNYHLRPEESEEETKLQTDQPSQSHVRIKSSASDVLPINVTHREDVMTTETQLWPDQESIKDEDVRTIETVYQGPGSEQKKETLKFSPDSLHPGSRDEARSNSDGDSSSGLEMDYIVVSGTVKEAERVWHSRPKQGDKQSKGTRTTMETFSTLVFAATALQSQVQTRHREDQENTEQVAQNHMIRNTESPVSPATEDDIQSELLSHSQTNNTTEAFSPPHSIETSQTQTEEKGFEEKSGLVGRSVSPSLRYPSDNFLKTREEVYVHSQISMEDSDEGGQSPSAPPTCPTSLKTFQEWGGQLERQDTSETQSPVLTNSSVSHSSSLTGTPLSETGISDEKGLGLPFSGDLMEEENYEEEQEEETDPEHEQQTNWTPHIPKQREQLLPSSDLISFTEEPCTQQAGAQFNQDRMLQEPGVYHDGHSLKSESLVLRRHQNASSQPTNEEAAYQWTETHHVTQGQPQYGYNYHHIDQRTENQGIYLTCGATRPSSLPNSTDVYAEFTSETTAVLHGCEQMQGYYEHRAGVEYILDNSKVQYRVERHFGEDSSSVSSQPQCSQYQDKDQYQYEADPPHYQPSYQSDVHTEREDHVSYVPEGYVHFLLSRFSQQGDSESGMMTTKVPGAETAEVQDNREDPLSLGDVSAGSSNHKRKLAAPPLNVSLEHSEGSILSEDALDTDDDLDTGDDLDINIDELDTSDEADSLELNRPEGSEEARHGAAAATDDILPRRQSADNGRDSRLWRSVVIGEHEHRIDMKSIEPYKRVISHGGYYADQNAIIVFAACFLPDSDCDNYNYVMENLFLYVISTLELMVAEDYMIVYLNGATPRMRMPGFTWMKKCYQMIDRRLKKNLKSFVIVHPSWFIRTVLGITRPFISSKFSSKIKYVHSLRELGEIIPMEYVHIPHSIVKLDSDLQNTAAKAERRGNADV